MSAPLTLITPTGDRPWAWTLCQRWMAAQDYPGAVRWIVVDDGPVPQEVTFSRSGWQVEVLRPQPYWQEGKNTQARNLCAAIDQVIPGAPVLIIEDDDHYAPDWLSVAAAALEQHELVGETCMLYYNVHYRQWFQHRNTAHASLCATGVRGSALAALRAFCTPQIRYADLELWRGYCGRSLLFPGARVTGIKGLPGRTGICQGHQRNYLSSQPDAEGQVLRARLGGDAEVYLAG